MHDVNGLMSKALQSLLEIPKIDDIKIISFLSGCISYDEYEDMISASSWNIYKKKRVVYTVNEVLVKTLVFRGIGVDFGKNVKITNKKVGLAGLTE